MTTSSNEQEPLTDGAEKLSFGSQSITPSLSPTQKFLLGLKPTPQIVEDVIANLEERLDAPKYPTGLATLDEMLWGMHKQEVLVLAARTSQGKSSLAFQLALTLAQHARVGYFSLEMSKEQLVERMIAYKTRINNKLIRHGLAKAALRKHYDSLRKYSQTLSLLVDDENGYSWDRIVEICTELKFDFVFVDYIQMISARGYKSKLEAIDEYVRKFKELSRTLNFGGVMVSQVNREGVGASMGLEHLKGSGTLEEHPDTVLLMEWDYKKNEFWIRVEKQRHGECGKVQVDYEPEYFTFSDYVCPARVLPPVSGKGRGTSSPPFGYND